MSIKLCTNIEKMKWAATQEPEDYYKIVYNILKNDCITYDLSLFKHFYVIRRLPLYNTHIFQEEINLIENILEKSSENIKNRILKGLIEVYEGHGTNKNFSDSIFKITKNNIKTCGHITHNITHLIHALKIGIDVKDFDLILEFGGGYGGMAKLCNDMGYNNTYYIYDLPEIKTIQEYYLNKLNVSHKIITDYNELKKIEISNKKKLFIATWSLSEVDFDLREKILDVIKDFDAVIIVYQNKIWNRHNGKYFGDGGIFQKNLHKIESWHILNIPHIKWDGGNYYLLGN